MKIRNAIPRRLSTPLAVAISAVVAFGFAFASVRDLSLQPRQIQIAAAATHVLVDSPDSWILDQRARTPDFESLSKRAHVFGNLIASVPVRERIARRIGVPVDDIAAVSRLTAGLPATMREPDSEQRVNQIVLSKKRYRIETQSDPARPILHIYTQAPTAPEAERLADFAVVALREQLHDLAVREDVARSRRPIVEELGPARGEVINGGTTIQISGLTFLVVFSITCGLLLLSIRVRMGWAASAREPSPDKPSPRRLAPVANAVDGNCGHASAGGDWPRTTRVLPWLVAWFMVILWLVPFNTTELRATLPFDLTFDRLVLPVIVGVWALALAAGGRAVPRVRITWIHGAVASFAAVVCLGVVVDAHYLNQTLEFSGSTKKLTLIVSYLVLLLMVSSIVRVVEVPAFFKLTLILAVLCALGTIWEYRFQYNVFYDLTDKLLPDMFSVGAAESAAVDDQGRFLTRGPGEHPLETVAMLSMALPIALVGIMHANRQRTTILYALAACILLAAALSTYRKSALLAPVSVGLTLAYFRRRELLRLAPLAAVAILLINALSPGAIAGILFQLQPDRLGVGTVSDRTSDYDAIRPDLWTHLAFGRGFGSYDHVSYRILDSEILSRIVDTGILGLLSLVLMIVVIVGSARRLIRWRHSIWSPPALAVAAAAVAYLVLAFLFDVSSFPHTPYILMSLTALLAVVIARPSEEEFDEEANDVVVQMRSPAPPPAGRGRREATDWLAEPEVPVGR